MGHLVVLLVLDKHLYAFLTWSSSLFSLFYSSKIEVAYQEAVALKRQEELIREEEAAWIAENEQKTKRGAADKEKKSKKKQVWQYFYI